ncbi:DAO1 [Candida oxycetoniae]|uniref:DAO1 n=1 Tax=Candida oxycetoniae TaxID=497107 RepID=A0AAI9SWK9_9ASCO|nr:DAO1 [Candida oxycetoniae]KAI3403870.1 DAO1 [Candida oxycetoniae]
MTQVVVLGAGVLGLTTAIELKKWDPNLQISIIGHHLPGDIDPSYTSPYAGANWQSFATFEDTRLQKIDEKGYKRFLQLAKDDFRSGIWSVDTISYFTDYAVSRAKGNFRQFIPWYRNVVEDFKIIDSQDIPFADISFGTKFKGVVISVPTYLSFLVQQNKELGNAIAKIPLLKDIEEARNFTTTGKKADIVINASGLGASALKGVDDRKINFSVRGQVLLVKNNIKSMVSVDGFPGFPNEMLYMMPRKEGGTIIGGCFLAGDKNEKEDKELTSRLINRAIKYAPEIVDPEYKNNPIEIEIKQVNVGFRPFREDGPRVELDKHRKWLIHEYGAGAGGYQGSYGLAQEVVKIVKDNLSKGNSKL